MYFLYKILGAKVSISIIMSYESLFNEFISLGVNTMFEIFINSISNKNIVIMMVNNNLS